MELMNPVITYREHGEQTLREQLEVLDIEVLRKVIKAYTPDMNKTIYRVKNKEKVINYIVERSYHLSRLGQCFRTLD